MTDYYPDLTTLDAVKRYKRLTANNADENAEITRIIHALSLGIQTHLGRCFVTYYDTKEYQDWDRDTQRYGYVLNLIDDLLEVDSITDPNSTALATYILRPRNSYPKSQLVSDVAPTSTNYNQFYTITGWWGAVAHYATAWLNTGVTGTLASASTATLSVADGTLYDVLQYLRLADEIMQVTSISGNTLTIRRGQLGTTATSHASVALYTYQHVPDLENAVIRYVSYIYENKDATSKGVKFLDGSVIQFNEMSDDIQATIRRYERRYIGEV